MLYSFAVKPDTVFRVLVCIDLSSEAGRRKLGGIYRFLGGGYAWDMTLIRSRKEFETSFESRIADSAYDGLLMAVPETGETKAVHAELNLPTVFIDYVDQSLLKGIERSVFIHDDDRDIANLAAQHLLKQGTVKTYAYAGANDPRPWNRLRGDRFAAILARRKIALVRLADADSLATDDLAAWLKSLTPPVGILAAYDDTAGRILDACRTAGLRVPTDVSVLGIGNDDLICPHTTPPLSSVIPDFEEEGYLAARELQALMMRKVRPTRREILCGCKGIAQRGSTVGEKSAALLVQQALAFIDANAFDGITAADVVRHLRVSRRLADLRFREVTGSSILAYITELRLKRVKELLATTSLPIAEIARQCGYEPANLKNLFARRFKRSMRAYRNAFRAK